MQGKRILVIAPHPDDEILGVGGAIAKYVDRKNELTILTIAGHRPPLYTEEVYQQTIHEAKKAHAAVNANQSIFLGIPA